MSLATSNYLEYIEKYFQVNKDVEWDKKFYIPFVHVSRRIDFPLVS